MLKKRHLEDGQRSKEEIQAQEAAEDQDSSGSRGGTFERADTAVMKGRKIVRASRSAALGSSTLDTSSPNPFRTINLTSNPTFAPTMNGTLSTPTPLPTVDEDQAASASSAVMDTASSSTTSTPSIGNFPTNGHDMTSKSAFGTNNTSAGNAVPPTSTFAQFGSSNGRTNATSSTHSQPFSFPPLSSKLAGTNSTSIPPLSSSWQSSTDNLPSFGAKAVNPPFSDAPASLNLTSTSRNTYTTPAPDPTPLFSSQPFASTTTSNTKHNSNTASPPLPPINTPTFPSFGSPRSSNQSFTFGLPAAPVPASGTSSLPSSTTATPQALTQDSSGTHSVHTSFPRPSPTQSTSEQSVSTLKSSSSNSITSNFPPFGSVATSAPLFGSMPTSKTSLPESSSPSFPLIPPPGKVPSSGIRPPSSFIQHCDTTFPIPIAHTPSDKAPALSTTQNNGGSTTSSLFSIATSSLPLPSATASTQASATTTHTATFPSFKPATDGSFTSFLTEPSSNESLPASSALISTTPSGTTPNPTAPCSPQHPASSFLTSQPLPSAPTLSLDTPKTTDTIRPVESSLTLLNSSKPASITSTSSLFTSSNPYVSFPLSTTSKGSRSVAGNSTTNTAATASPGLNNFTDTSHLPAEPLPSIGLRPPTSSLAPLPAPADFRPQPSSSQPSYLSSSTNIAPETSAPPGCAISTDFPDTRPIRNPQPASGCAEPLFAGAGTDGAASGRIVGMGGYGLTGAGGGGGYGTPLRKGVKRKMTGEMSPVARPSRMVQGGGQGGSGSGSEAAGKREPSEEKLKQRTTALNRSFQGWCADQLRRNPYSAWVEGLQDYIRYTRHLEHRYGPAPGDASTTQATVSQATTDRPLSSRTTTTSDTHTTSITLAPEPERRPTITARPSSAAHPAPVPATAPSPPTPSPFPTSFPSFAAPPSTSSFAPPSTPFTFQPKTLDFAATPLASPPPASKESQGAATLGGQADVEGDEDAMPLLQPDRAVKEGKDPNEVMEKDPVRVYRFSKETKQWVDNGKCSIALYRQLDQPNKAWLATRNLTGKVMWSASLKPGMRFTKMEKQASVAFYCRPVIDNIVKDETMFRLKVRDGLGELVNRLEQLRDGKG